MNVRKRPCIISSGQSKKLPSLRASLPTMMLPFHSERLRLHRYLTRLINMDTLHFMNGFDCIINNTGHTPTLILLWTKLLLLLQRNIDHAPGFLMNNRPRTLNPPISSNLPRSILLSYLGSLLSLSWFSSSMRTSCSRDSPPLGDSRHSPLPRRPIRLVGWCCFAARRLLGASLL